MDQDAIQQLMELSTAATVKPDTDVPTAIMPGNCKVVSLEQYQETPSHMAARFTTERLEDFAAYVNEEAPAEGDTAVFVDPDGSGAQAIIDQGSHQTPLWGRHTATLAMVKTPEFRALDQATNGPMSQRQLTDWLEDWAPIITPMIGEEALSIAKAITAIRRIDIKASVDKTREEGDFSASRSSLEKVEARSGAGRLPELFDVQCRVYPCTASRNIRARLTLKTGGDEPRFNLRIIGLDNLMREVAEEIELELKQRVSTPATDIRFFVGHMSR